MDEKHVQIIEPSPIQLVARRIDSVSFDGGVSAPEQSKVKGKCNFTNRISKVDSQEDGTDYFYVTVTVSVKPDEGYSYYSLDMSVTGVFVAADRNMDRGALEYRLLTDGVRDLYAYARDRASMIMQGGTFGEPRFPLLDIAF